HLHGWPRTAHLHGRAGAGANRPTCLERSAADRSAFDRSAAMIRHAAGLLAVLVAASGAPIEAGRPAADLPSDVSVERHHYSIGARIRPLLVFWIGRSGIGDAIVTKHLGPDEAAYAL